MHLAYATSPLNPLVAPSGRVRSREGLQKIYPQNLKKENREKRNKNRKMKMTKHNIYIRVNCTCSDQPKPPSNSSIRLYTSIMCISGHFILKNGIRTSIFHPTMHENNESILVPVCKCIITLKLSLPKSNSIPVSYTHLTLPTKRIV